MRVGPFSSAQAYDRLGFIYREGTYDVGVDNYNAWIAPPAGMLADLIARDLATSRAASAVLQGPSAMTPDYELSGRVEELDERETGGCTAHLRLRALFVRIDPKGPRQVVWEDVFASDQPCTPGDPQSFAEAMSKAAQEVSTAVVARVAGEAGLKEGFIRRNGDTGRPVRKRPLLVTPVLRANRLQSDPG